MSRYKQFIGGAIIAFIVLAFLAFEPLTEKWLLHSLKTHLRKGLGIEIQIAEVHREKGNIIIKNPQFNGTLEGQAERLIVHFTNSIWRRNLTVDLEIHNPQFLIGKMPSPELPSLTRPSAQPSRHSLYHIEGTLKISQGQLKLVQSELDNSSAEIHFNLSGEWDSDGENHYSAHLYTDDVSSNGTWLEIEENAAEERQIKVQMLNANASSVAGILKSWGFLNDWIVTEGYLNGFLSIVTKNEDEPKVNGGFIAEQLTLLQPNYGLTAVIPTLNMSLLEQHTQLVGRSTLLQPAFMSFEQDKNICISKAVADLTGDFLEFSASVMYTRKDHEKAVEITGYANLFTEEAFLEAKISADKDSVVTFKSKALDPEHYQVNIDLVNALQSPWLPDNLFIKAIVHRQAGQMMVDGTINGLEQPLRFKTLLEHEESIFDNLKLVSGWIEGTELPLNLYLKPFIKQLEPADVKGLGSFSMAFDINHAVIQYSLIDFSIEHDLYSFNSQRPLEGTHYVNWKDTSEGGVVFLSNATYFDKTHGCSLEDLQAQCMINNSSLCAKNIEAFCNGIYGKGSLELKHSVFGNSWNIDIHATALSGKLSNFQDLATKFHQPITFLDKCSIEGEVGLRSEGADLSIAISENGKDVKGSIHGELMDVFVLKKLENLSIQELSCHFDYGLESEQLAITEIQGVLVAGSDEHAEEYMLAGDYLLWDTQDGPNADFDLWVGDRTRDIIRLVGKAKTTESQSDALRISFDNELTHFGDVRLNAFDMVVNNRSQLDLLDIQLSFDMKTLLQDLQRLSRTGLLYLSRHFIQELGNTSSANGTFQLALHYDQQTSLLDYHLIGKDIAIGNKNFKHVLLEGKKRDKIWSIDQLKLDELSLAAEFLHDDDHWRIDFLGIRAKEALLIGMEGKFFPNTTTFEGKINLLETNLAHLDRWPTWHAFIDEWIPTGELKATGNITVTWAPSRPKWRVTTLLNGIVNNFSVKGQHPQHLKCILECNPNKLTINTSYQHEGQPYQLKLNAELPRLLVGDLQITTETDNAPLVIEWQKDVKGITIQRINGSCNGITAQLKATDATTPKSFNLIGEVVVNVQQAKRILSNVMLQAVDRWNLGGQFRLQGKWSLKEPEWDKWLEKLHFTGTFEGKDCYSKLGKWTSFASDLVYNPPSVAFQNLLLQDEAGSGNIPLLTIEKCQNELWEVNIPHAEMKNVDISKLRNVEDLYVSPHSGLIIQRFSLDNFMGNPLDTASWKGEGNIDWEYPTQDQGMLLSLLKVPQELLSMTGLDLSIFSPVSGCVQYQIENSRLLLKKLKDTYSAGKSSKFSLAKKSPSFIDFDGHIFVQLRMRQYNLMFKLVELFTVTIEGPIVSPTYTLIKQ